MSSLKNYRSRSNPEKLREEILVPTKKNDSHPNYQNEMFKDKTGGSIVRRISDHYKLEKTKIIGKGG